MSHLKAPSVGTTRTPRGSRTLAAIGSAVVAFVAAASVAVQSSPPPSAASPSALSGRISGAGATFPNPIYQRWVGEFQRANPGVTIAYESVGSGAGIKRITDKTASFGATDAPLSDKQVETMGGAEAVIQFPSVAGGVVPIYNLPGVTAEVRFTGEVLADIFLGKISKWNDAKLAALNPGVELPATAISPVWRSDGSGTTFVWTSYLSGQSKDFQAAIGKGAQVKWPFGTGGKGNPGVTEVVRQSAGSIGYVEHNYATANKIQYGSIRNAAGKFVKATPESIAAAGKAAADALKGQVLRADLWNQPGEACYPVSAFTYIVLHRDLSATTKSSQEAEALVAFMRWALTDGQKLAAEMDYAPLDPAVREKALAALRLANYAGQPVGAAKP